MVSRFSSTNPGGERVSSCQRFWRSTNLSMPTLMSCPSAPNSFPWSKLIIHAVRWEFFSQKKWIHGWCIEFDMRLLQNNFCLVTLKLDWNGNLKLVVLLHKINLIGWKIWLFTNALGISVSVSNLMQHPLYFLINYEVQGAQIGIKPPNFQELLPSSFFNINAHFRNAFSKNK